MKTPCWIHASHPPIILAKGVSKLCNRTLQHLLSALWRVHERGFAVCAADRLQFRISEKQHATAGRGAGVETRLDCRFDVKTCAVTQYTIESQEEALAALAMERALPLLPPLSRAPGGPPAYLAHPAGRAAASGGGGGVAASVLERLSELLADGGLDGGLNPDAGQSGSAVGQNATAVSAAAEGEPPIAADLANVHVMPWLLAPKGTGELCSMSTLPSTFPPVLHIAEHWEH